MEVLRMLGIRAFPSLSALLKDADPEIRLFSVNILHEIGARESLPMLFEAMGDTDINVRAAAAETLGKIRDSRALALLKNAINDEPWVASAAINAIGEIGGGEALDTLYGCLEQEEHRPMAVLAIGKSGSSDSIRRLAPLLKSGILIELVLQAVVAISLRERTLPPEGFFTDIVPVLTELLGTSDSQLRKAAFIALCWSGSGTCMPQIVDAVKDPELQEHALECLMKTGRPAAAQIREALRSSFGPHRVILANMLSTIGESDDMLEFAGDDDPEVRTEVALALGAPGSDRAAATLKKMLTDISEEVRIAAEKSLRSLHRS
jgi:HEAT repeat protein